MSTFKDIALPLIARGVPVTPVLPNSKKAFLPDWPTSATTDLQQITNWDIQYPGYNGAAVATGKPNGTWFFEADSPEVWERIKTDTGNTFPLTYRVRSRERRGHLYFNNTPAALAMGNISQSYVKCGDWSARVVNQYVVAAGSIHPHSHEPYQCIDPNAKIIPAPDWLVAWCISQKTEKSPAKDGAVPVDEKGLIPHGYIHGWQVTQCGKMRAMGMEIDEIEESLLKLTHRMCAPPIDEAVTRQVARSFGRYAPGGGITELIFNQQPELPPVAVEAQDLPTFEPEPYPTFPSYVMVGTSIKRNLVDPICEHNSRIDYFMWLPAMALLLNYVGVKIKRKGVFDSRPVRGSIYMVLIGKRGDTNKSSSVSDAMNYFNYAGLLAHHNRETKNAEGKTLVWTAGSPEGLGIEMQKSNCKNALLYYDELQQLVKKAGIEGSTMNSNLLTLYESGKFSNSVKATKEVYSLDPETYCASLVACTTDASFPELWSRMTGEDTGLNDRFFFVLQPKPLPDKRLKVDINTLMGSQETRRLVDKALAQSEFEYQDVNNSNLQELVIRGNRFVERALKWALAIAIDLGLNIVDDECIDRGCDIVKYEIAVKKYLKSYEAVTREGEMQQRIRHNLEMAGGTLETRQLQRICHAERVGTSDWDRAYGGLIRHGIIAEYGTGKRDDPKIVKVLIKRDINEEEL